jgi:hypothetical protein
MNASDTKPVLGLLSRSGPEMPPDVVPPSSSPWLAPRSPSPGPRPSPAAYPSPAALPSPAAPSSPPADPASVRGVADEPTELLAVIAPPPGAAARVSPPPPRIAARAVIVYEPEPRRSWGLWIFTGLLVALTVGVVLGQAVAPQPVSRPAPAVTTWTPPPPYDAPVGVPFRPPPTQG